MVNVKDWANKDKRKIGSSAKCKEIESSSIFLSVIKRSDN